MLNWISQTWNNSFWDKLYLIFAFIVLISAIRYIVHRLKISPKKKIRFIEKANAEGCTAIAKLSCLTKHGIGKTDYYSAEYMYVVDDKSYYVTYNMSAILPIDDHKDEMNADMLLTKIKQVMIVYYNKNNPAKVFSKIEVFTSTDAINKVKTPKNNVYRDVDKEWTEAFDLVQY